MTTIAAIPQTTTRWHFRAEIAIRWIVALVLLTGAVLKADQITTEPMHGTGWQVSRPLAILLVEYEAILSFWLLSGLYIRFSRAVAISTFLVFFVFSAYEGWQGSPSCNCFGKASMSPWITSALDLLLVSGLLALSHHSFVQSQTFLARRFFFLSLGVILSIATIPTMLGLRPLGLIGAPDVMPDMDFFTFGTINPEQARKLDHEFRIENRGDRPVRLLKSSSTCSCTVAELPKDPIPPGGYTLVRVTAHWPGRFGVQREQVIVETDSPKRSSLALWVTANVVTAAVHWPNVVDFGDVIEGETLSRTVTVAPGPGQKSFRVLAVAVADPFITLRQEPQIKGVQSEQTWVVTLTAKSVKDKIRSLARLTLDLPGNDPMIIPIAYTILPAIRLTPRSVLFWSKQPGLRAVGVDSPLPLNDVKIQSADLEPAAFDVQIRSSLPTSSGFHSVVDVNFLRSVDHLNNATLTFSAGSFSGQMPIVLMP